MSLIAQCPQCLTGFHVAPEQLREALGWVRCGICNEVFSAHAHSLPEIPSAPVLGRQEPMLRGSDESLSPETTPKAGKTVAAPSPPKPRRATWVWVPSVALVFLFLLQLGLGQRLGFATHFPLIAAWLQSLCGASQACSLRDIRNISIKDSNFEAVDANHFKLSAGLANASDLRLQAPSLAVDLTDASDSIVLSKSFGPKEWGALADTLPGQAVWPITLWMEISLTTDAPAVAGYRLKAFYP